MKSCRPYGNARKASALVIGHDPGLQNSKAQANYAFFLDYLQKPVPSKPSERRKYDLASSVVDYIRHLTSSLLELKGMYFTNLCNEFLDRPLGKGTVLIPDEYTDRGAHEIEATLERGSFKVILPMAPQVFYHLVRMGFVTDSDEQLKQFQRQAKPKLAARARKVYVPVGRSPFLMVCGKKYHHRRDRVPIIPILHIKQWPLNESMKPHYGPLMEMTVANVFSCLQGRKGSNRDLLKPS